MPHCGAWKWGTNSPPRNNTKIVFPVGKRQFPYLWEICNNLIKMHEAPYTNCPHLIYVNDRTIKRILIIPFLFSKMFNVVNEKQTTNALNLSIFFSWWKRFFSVLILLLHWSYITQSLYYLTNISQSFARPCCLNNLCTKKVSFPLNSSNNSWIVFPPCANWSWW